MKISAPACTPLGLGRGVEKRLFCAVIALGACLGLACSDDDPAEQTGVGGSSAQVDASVRDLPGDGREGTPDFDTESRQRTPIGPRRLVENIDERRDDFGLGGDTESEDAGAVDAEPSDGGAS